MAPLVIDMFCGLGGWAEGFLAEGYTVIGFDIEQWPYPGQLVVQDVQRLHGSQFRDATVIVASPPCQAYSYRAMPWKRAKALPPPDNTLFEICSQIQREASEAAGHKIPLIVENVRGAQKWVGRSKWHYGSYYLWGDVPALMPITGQFYKNTGGSWFSVAHNTESGCGNNPDGRKIPGNNGPRRWADRNIQRLRDYPTPFTGAGETNARKQASALIAKIPFPLAQHIARVFKPEERIHNSGSLLAV